MKLEVVSEYGRGIDTEVRSFWRDGTDLIAQYEDGSEERYRHDEAIAAGQDGESLDELKARVA